MRGNQVHPTNPFTEFKQEDIEQSIPARFEQMVEKYSDRLAVKDQREALTYTELNQIANGIARTLWNEIGDEANEPICLLLDHHAYMIGAILGVLKAGKCYVPLNPSVPKERLKFILEESGATSILTDSANFSLAVELASEGIRVIQMDECMPLKTVSNSQGVSSPHSLAFICYTSGSTGKPKGVVQVQRNLLHTIMNYTNEFHITPEHRILLLYSYAFTGSKHSIFGSLLNGAAVIVFDFLKDGLENLPRFLCREKVTLIHLSASLFRNFCNFLQKGDSFPDLRFVYTGAEPVRVTDVDLFKTYFQPPTMFVFNYATTEASDIRRHFLDHTTEIPSDGLHLGNPVKGKEVILLDEDGKKASPGSSGEIAVRSEFFPLGYWKQPELTRTVYLPDPDGGNQRIYRTGDLGRFGSDGHLYHLGRKDFQVKIRGYRVEIGEVETRLIELDEVKEAVVHGHQDLSGETRLVAYIVPQGEHSPNVSALRQELSKTLPEYMIPSAFLMLDRLPLTPNGKVDRKSLPDPGSQRPELDTPFASPRTRLEQELAEIWSNILGLEQVGVNDPFLDLGGDSLRATKLISRVLEHFKVEVPMKALMEAPTITEMAETILNHKTTQIGPDEMERFLDEVEKSSSDD